MNNNGNQNNSNNQYQQQPNNFNNQYQQPNGFNNQYQQQPSSFNNQYQQQPNDFNNQYQQQPNSFNNQYQQQPNGFNNQYQQQPNGFNNQYQQQSSKNNEFIGKVKSTVLETKQCEDFIDGQDILDNKIISVFSYIGIFFLIPLIAGKKSRYARFHANQGLLLFITEFIVWFVYGIISGIISAACVKTEYIWGVPYATSVNPVGSIILLVLSILVSAINLSFMILGIYNVVKGKAVELPIIGRFRLIKTVPAQVPVDNMNNGFNPNGNQGMNNNFNPNNNMNNGFNPNGNMNNGFNNYNSSPVTPPKQDDFVNTFNNNQNENQ